MRLSHIPLCCLPAAPRHGKLGCSALKVLRESRVLITIMKTIVKAGTWRVRLIDLVDFANWVRGTEAGADNVPKMLTVPAAIER